ncbi:MAG: hypothetical protein ACXWKD_04520 [Caldimonas sp.]
MIRSLLRPTVPVRALRARRAARALVALGAACSALLHVDAAIAHGYAGKRFFPATLATEDPFVADELSLPTVAWRKTGGDEGPSRDSSASLDFTKRLTPDIGIGFGASYLRQKPDGGPAAKGFDNVSASVKYQFFRSDERETILSVGADWDIGGTGSKRVGAEPFSTVTPTVFFGKGFGALPEEAMYLRPLALTGTAGVGIPARASTKTIDESGSPATERHPDAFVLGLALQYSLPYLQSFVKDVGLREPLNRMIPIVEVTLQKPFDRGGGPLVGTVNPGVLVAGKYLQLGIEAVIPVNKRTGGRTGLLVQLHFFLDDVFPGSIGKPLRAD